jgi:hypothetical protein
MNSFFFYGTRNELNAFKREWKALGLLGDPIQFLRETPKANGKGTVKTWEFMGLVPSERVEEARALHHQHNEAIGCYRV